MKRLKGLILALLLFPVMGMLLDIPGGGGTGDPPPDKEKDKTPEQIELENLKEENKRIKKEKDDADKRIKDFEKTGKTAEQLLKEKEESTRAEKIEARKDRLDIARGKIMSEAKIPEAFAGLIKITDAMTNPDLEFADAEKMIKETVNEYKAALDKQAAAQQQGTALLTGGEKGEKKSMGAILAEGKKTEIKNKYW
jgi:hypothetical protein